MPASEHDSTVEYDGAGHSVFAGKTLSEGISELVANGSIELSTGNNQQISEASGLLPYGMSAFVPSLPGREFLSSLAKLRALHEYGFDPVPHLAARKIESRQELEKFLKQAVRDFSVHRVLLVGGDVRDAIGPYQDSAAILREGLLSELGICEVALAGYPEGHPRIPQQILLADLEEKLELATNQGLDVEIVSQFCFAPSRIIEYCAFLSRLAPDVPVKVGMAGPTNTAGLIRYARYCGVSASLQALGTLGVKAVSQMTHADPTEQLTALAHYCATRQACNVIGAHIFSFGGFVKTARWMRLKCRGK